MGRTPTYDRLEVVRAARGVFWRTGYEGASLPELEEATGLARSSLYHAFGSKRGLYDAAVESYLDEMVRPRLVPLARDRVAPDAILDYLGARRCAPLGCLGERLPADQLGDRLAGRRRGGRKAWSGPTGRSCAEPSARCGRIPAGPAARPAGAALRRRHRPGRLGLRADARVS